MHSGPCSRIPAASRARRAPGRLAIVRARPEFARKKRMVEGPRSAVHASGKTRKGNRWLRTALIEAAAGASRAKHSALQARFRRVLRHRGPKKAVVALAHALLRIAYHVLADGTSLP
jgi:hypothetical protein